MNKKQIEASIKRSIALETPDLFEEIASTPIQKLPEEDYILKDHRQKRHGISKLQALYTACTSVALVLFICFGFVHNYYSVDSIIAIDVNPSIEIRLNKSYRVLSVRANNADGEKLIQNKRFKNKNCDIVITDLTNSLSSEGYINQDKNSILVSVSNSNDIKAEEVKSRVVTDIKTSLNKKEIEPVIYKQSISNSTTKKLEGLAKKYHISFGKMKLISSLIEKDPTLTIEELAPLTIEEIPEYVEKRQIKMVDVIECEETSPVVAQKQVKPSKEETTSSKEQTTSSHVTHQDTSTLTNVTTSTGTSVTTETTDNTSLSSEATMTEELTDTASSTVNSGADSTTELQLDNTSSTETNNSEDMVDTTDTPNSKPSHKPNHRPNKNQKPNKGDKNHSTTQNGANSSTEINDIGNSGSYEESTETSSSSTNSSWEQEEEEDDLNNSGIIDTPDDITEIELDNSSSQILPETSNTSSIHAVSGGAYSK